MSKHDVNNFIVNDPCKLLELICSIDLWCNYVVYKTDRDLTIINQTGFRFVNSVIRVFFESTSLLSRTVSWPHMILNKKTFRLKNRSKRRGQNWANQTHKRKEIKFSDHHFLIYANVICRFCIFLMCACHIKKMQKLQIWYGYIKKWWSENFISFLCAFGWPNFAHGA